MRDNLQPLITMPKKISFPTDAQMTSVTDAQAELDNALYNMRQVLDTLPHPHQRAPEDNETREDYFHDIRAHLKDAIREHNKIGKVLENMKVRTSRR